MVTTARTLQASVVLIQGQTDRGKIADEGHITESHLTHCGRVTQI